MDGNMRNDEMYDGGMCGSLMPGAHVYGVIPNGTHIQVKEADADHVTFYDTDARVMGTREFSFEPKPEEEEVAILLADPVSNEALRQAQEAFPVREKVGGRQVPIYIYFHDIIAGEVYLGAADEGAGLRAERFVFLFGEKALRSFFMRTDVIVPTRLFAPGDLATRIVQVLSEMTARKEEDFAAQQKRVEDWYRTHEGEIRERINARKARVLFSTSRFTSVLQYHMKNLARAMEQEGQEVRVLMEEDVIFMVSSYDVMANVADFLPDIFFMIDHFRFENRAGILPPELVVMTWIQDPICEVMKEETVGKLLPTDVLLSHYTSNAPLMMLYRGRPMLAAAIPANEEVYRPYLMTDAERRHYAADICFVCHGADVEGHIAGILKTYGGQSGGFIDTIYRTYARMAKAGHFLYAKEDFVRMFRDVDDTLPEVVVETFSEDMYFWFNQQVYRQALCDWILEAGYTNVKLWGSGWLEEEKYAPFAMGIAPNGEILSKILQSSKIVMGNNIMTTGAARVWETMLSGGFYLSNDVPRRDDWVDLRMILKEEEDVIFFNGREDMLRKIEFYLSHDKERERMARRGREVALERMTFRRLARKIQKETPGILEMQGA